MTMKFTQLRTHWDTEEAESIIGFLDELREMLWTAYGADIVEQQKMIGKSSDCQNDRTIKCMKDDEADF